MRRTDNNSMHGGTVHKTHYDDTGMLVRDVLGDGSCGYRAIMFGLLEHNWTKAVDALPAAVASTMPSARPSDLAAFFARHDAVLCQAARTLAETTIRTDAEIHSWAGNPRDENTEAARAVKDVCTPFAYMDEVALHALSKAFRTRIAIKFRHTVLVAPFKDNNDKRAVGVCLKPSENAAPSDFVGHYMLCYPGKVLSNNTIQINPWKNTTTTV